MSQRTIRKWLVSYSVMYSLGVVKEHQVEVKASSLMEAFRLAAAQYVAPALKEPDALQAVIWEVCIEKDAPLFEVKL